MVPAQCVPWLLPSIAVSPGTKLTAPLTLGRRSGWFQSIPVSSTATLTPLPREQPHAAGALICCTPNGTVSACGEGWPSKTSLSNGRAWQKPSSSTAATFGLPLSALISSSLSDRETIGASYRLTSYPTSSGSTPAGTPGAPIVNSAASETS